MATPEFIRKLRATAGQQLLWMPGIAAVVFDDDGRVLLGRRADSGRWTVIAGIPEPGEQPAACAVREVFEETAVHCVPVRIAHVRALPPHTYPNGDICQFMDITLVCRAVGGTARVNDDESLEVAWFPLYELPDLSPHEHLRLEHALADGPTWFEPAPQAAPPRGSMGSMTDDIDVPRVVLASREISAPAATIFELIADPAQQPRWDGNDNLSEAPAGQRIRAEGAVFAMTLTKGQVRENRVVEFEEGRRIAWLPAEPGKQPPGHLWRWELEPLDANRTLVTHTYDWTGLTDEQRLPRARSTTPDKLQASVDRLAELAEKS